MKLIANIITKTSLILILLTANSYAMFFQNSDDPKVYETPVSVPFDLTKKGNKTEVLVEIKEAKEYIFGLEFLYDDSRNSYDIVHDKIFIEWLGPYIYLLGLADKPFFRAKPVKPSAPRIIKLVGCDKLPNCELGIPTQTYLIITKLGEDKTYNVVNETTNIVIDQISDGTERIPLDIIPHKNNKTGKIHLSPGRYKFVISTTKDSPEFSEANLNFYLLINP